MHGRTSGRPIRWSQVAQKVLDKRERAIARIARRSKVYRKYQYSDLDSYKKLTNSGRLRLESFEGAFRYLFEHGNIRLGYLQQKFVDATKIAFMKKMFGDDLLANLNYLSTAYMIDELNDTLAIVFPRRSGKTVAAAIIIAVIAVSQPNGNSIMYNLTALQAEEFITEVRKHLNVFEHSEEYGWEIEREDVRKMIRIKTRKFGTSNSIKSYASALHGNANINPCDSSDRRKPVNRWVGGRKGAARR